MKKTLALLLLFALQATWMNPSAQAQDSQTDARLRTWLKRYPEADENKDGILTKAEAAAYRETLQTSRKDAGTKTHAGPEPTYAEVSYGPHERHVFDLWLPEGAAESGRALPLVLYFHGGGFVAGSKEKLDPTPYLKAGFAAASANYRFVDGKETLGLAPLRDGARVVQFLRLHAASYHIDPDRIALSGSSAGAVIAMWTGYHDDLANPGSEDPVERASSRVLCLVPMSGPTNLDPVWIRANMGGPHVVHNTLPLFFGVHDDNYAEGPVRDLIRECSPISHVSPDDPPSLLLYGGTLGEMPLPPDTDTGTLIHHPYFGKVLKEKMDAAGVECGFQHGTGDRAAIFDFLNRHFETAPKEH